MGDAISDPWHRKNMTTIFFGLWCFYKILFYNNRLNRILPVLSQGDPTLNMVDFTAQVWFGLNMH